MALLRYCMEQHDDGKFRKSEKKSIFKNPDVSYSPLGSTEIIQYMPMWMSNHCSNQKGWDIMFLSVMSLNSI